MPFLFNQVRNVLKFAVSCQDCKLHLSAALWFSGSSAEQCCFTSLWWAFSLIKLILYLLQCLIFIFKMSDAASESKKRSKIAPSKTGSTMASVFDGTQWEHFLFQPNIQMWFQLQIEIHFRTTAFIIKGRLPRRSERGRHNLSEEANIVHSLGLCSDETQTQIGQWDLTLEETSL